MIQEYLHPAKNRPIHAKTGAMWRRSVRLARPLHRVSVSNSRQAPRTPGAGREPAAVNYGATPSHALKPFYSRCRQSVAPSMPDCFAAPLSRIGRRAGFAALCSQFSTFSGGFIPLRPARIFRPLAVFPPWAGRRPGGILLIFPVNWQLAEARPIRSGFSGPPRPQSPQRTCDRAKEVVYCRKVT